MSEDCRRKLPACACSSRREHSAPDVGLGYGAPVATVVVVVVLLLLHHLKKISKRTRG